MKYTATDIVYQARKFEAASLLLEKQTINNFKEEILFSTLKLEKQSFNHNLEPSLSLSGFSLELYLKSIYNFENNKSIGGHNINDLFNNLSNESKVSIKYFFENRKLRYIEENKVFLERNTIPIISFEESLLELSDIFVCIRYMYEKIDMEKNLFFREPIRQAIVNRINELGFYDEILD